MRTCKTCGAEYSFWSARGDGLCKQCRAKAEEANKREAERKEAERKQLALEKTKRIVSAILDAIADEPPLSYALINRGVTTTTTGGGGGGAGLLGALVGGALGGAVGAMIGGAAGGDGGPAKTTFSGELGFLVVTRDQVIVACLAASFLNNAGRISTEILEHFLNQMALNKVQRKTFVIGRTQLIRESNVPITQGMPVAGTVITLKSGTEAFRFQQSDLYVNEAPYPMPTAAEVAYAIEDQGPLATPAQFVARLRQGSSPVSEEHFAKMEGSLAYMAEVFKLLVGDSGRDQLMINSGCLAPNVRTALVYHMRKRAARAGANKVTLGFALAVLGGAVVLGALAEEPGAQPVLSALCGLGAAIVSIVSGVGLRRALWCRNVLIRSAQFADAEPEAVLHCS